MRQRVVAVVEDDPAMLQSIERLLNAYKFETATFSSAEAFLDGAASSIVTCLVLDIDLGGMSGIELRQRLAAAGSNLPVIFISAIDDEMTREMAIESGCVAYLPKPFLGSVLVGAINEAVAA
jgi:FixJ family two-component response regulator